MKDITGIVVSHNTHFLLKGSYESVRNFHSDMPIIIIDGSDANDPCRKYVNSLSSQYTTVILCNTNIGHGRGMHLGISHSKTKYILLFDSDIVMLKSPVEQMLSMMEPDTYGVGYLEKTGYDGFEYGAHQIHKTQGFMMMLHPYFALISRENYYKFHPFVHHGAPCYLAALDIHNKGLTSKIIKEFPGLGHSSGRGWNWTGQPREYIEHHTAGTRKDRVSRGKSEIEGSWDYGKDSNFRTGLFTKRI